MGNPPPGLLPNRVGGVRVRQKGSKGVGQNGRPPAGFSLQDGWQGKGTLLRLDWSKQEPSSSFNVQPQVVGYDKPGCPPEVLKGGKGIN